MEEQITFLFKLPYALCEEYHITEDTVFETYFDDDNLYVRMVSDEEIKNLIKENAEERKKKKFTDF